MASMALMPATTAFAAAPELSTPATPPALATDSYEEPFYQVSDSWNEFALRFGWWGVKTSGSTAKVGEYQGLAPSSPFWDADGLYSNGGKTLNYTLTGTESESTYGNLHYYQGPSLTANVEYDRFPHQLDRSAFPGFIPTTAHPSGPAPTIPYTQEGNTVGQNYAIRVQELKANFKGDITNDIKWKVNYFGLQKEGNRQATAVTHCFQYVPPTTAGSVCHVTSQSQYISWRTNEVEPAIEVNLADNFTVEYSRTMRSFEQGDSVVMADYPRSPGIGFGNSGVDRGTAGYAFVPDSTTEIDRLKTHAILNEDTDVYVLGYVGNTKNQLRDTNRHFGGADARITNNSIDGLTLTGYGKAYTENTQAPTTALNTLYNSPYYNTLYREPTTGFVSDPVNRDTSALGMKSRWRPFHDECCTLRSKLTLTGGYEYSTIRRNGWSATFIDMAGDPVFVQPDSNKNLFTVGAEEKWSPELTTYIRYKFIDTGYQLYGINPGAVTSFNDALNSCLPTQENRVELGGTWTPSEQLMLNGTVFIENESNHSQYVNYDSNSVPFVTSVMYAPTCKWTLTGGYANFSNYMDQDITLGGLTAGSAVTLPWAYNAKTDVFNVGTSYALTEKVQLVGDVEYVRGLNAITNAGSATYAPIAAYTLTEARTYRASAGVDYLLRARINTYFRYNYYDYQDVSTGLTTGQAHMLLGGVSATF